MTTPSNQKLSPQSSVDAPPEPVDVVQETNPKRIPFKFGAKSTDTDSSSAPGKDVPPKRQRRTNTSSTASNGKTSRTVENDFRPGVIEAGLTGMYGQIGLMVGMLDPQCGSIIVQNAQTMAASMEAWAKESPTAREFLNKMVTTSVIGQVIAAHAPVVAAIAMHHVPAIRRKFNPDAPTNGETGMGPQGNVKVAV